MIAALWGIKLIFKGKKGLKPKPAVHTSSPALVLVLLLCHPSEAALIPPGNTLTSLFSLLREVLCPWPGNSRPPRQSCGCSINWQSCRSACRATRRLWSLPRWQPGSASGSVSDLHPKVTGSHWSVSGTHPQGTGSHWLLCMRTLSM